MVTHYISGVESSNDFLGGSTKNVHVCIGTTFTRDTNKGPVLSVVLNLDMSCTEGRDLYTVTIAHRDSVFGGSISL